MYCSRRQTQVRLGRFRDNWKSRQSRINPAVISQESLHDPVFERVETNYAETPAFNQCVSGCGQDLLQFIHFSIDMNTNCLKDLRCGMLASWPPPHDRLDQACQFGG